MKIKNLGIATVAATFAVGSMGTAAVAVPGDGSPNSSAASITLSDCVIVSSKEISNIEYFADGAPATKDETFNTSSLDLTAVEGIETIDTVTVKSGTTVETFAVSCAPATAPDDGTAPEDGGTSDPEIPEEGTTPEDGTAPGDGSAEGDSAVITLSDCVIVSSKDISNIEFYSGGALVTKDESMNARSFDLTAVEGIETIDTVTVKSSTTVETFAVSCAPATTPDDSGAEGGEGTADNGAGSTTSS